MNPRHLFFSVVPLFVASAAAQTMFANVAVLGCTLTPNALSMAPSSTALPAIDFVTSPGLSNPMVLVGGLSASPVLLPGSGAGPCLLLPTPEVLLLMGPSQVITLAIPLTIPLSTTIWVQGVEVLPFDLRTTAGFLITFH